MTTTTGTSPPMTPQEWGDIVEEMEDLWPNSKVWGGAAVRLYPTFSDYPKTVARRAVARLFAEGRQTSPSPSALMAAIRALAQEGAVSTDRLPHRHNLGETPPSMRYGGLFADLRGPGLISCSASECDYPPRPCRCDGCRQDPGYADEERPMTRAELDTQVRERQAIEKAARGGER